MTILRSITERVTRASVVLLALTALLLAHPAHARGGQGGSSEAIETVRAIAPEADLIVILDDGAGQRKSAAGQAMTGMLVELGLAQQDGDLAGAWSELAGALGLDNARAFDELFGRRMVLVAEGTTVQGFGSWAIASVIPTPMALDIIKKLDAKGRDVEADQTVFAIEGGAYRLSLLRPRGAGAADHHRLVVVAPRGSNELLRRLVRGMIEQKNWDRLVGTGKRPAPSLTGSLLTRGVEVARIGVLQSDTGWRGQAQFEMPEFEQRSAGWAGEEFTALSKDAWLAMADEVDLTLLADSPLAAVLPIDADRLRELSAHCTGRVYLRLMPQGDHGASLSICLELKPTPEAAALADRAVRDIAGLLTGSRDAVPDYRGFMPGAVRTVPLRGEFAEQVLRPMVGGHPTIAWRTGAKGNSSWWTTRIAPGGTDHTSSLDELLVGLPAGEAGGRLVSLGTLRPGPTAGVIERGMDAKVSFRPTLERVETVHWTTRQRGTQLEISFDVRMDTSPHSPEPSARQQSRE